MLMRIMNFAHELLDDAFHLENSWKFMKLRTESHFSNCIVIYCIEQNFGV